MASVGGVSKSNYVSSLYNSSNIISGLASGMDTEGMIEGLVQSYQNKIQTLNNKATKIQWKQESYRSIIAKMTAFSSKYASYTSSTNLMSSAFFRSAVKVAAQGKNGEKVTASGRTDSDVVLNGVSQLATAALSLHSKQHKRAVVSCEKGYIEIMEYPRADRAVIVDAETGRTETVSAGRTADALRYELEDMEQAIRTGGNMLLPYTADVMDLMTRLRSEWGVIYPEEM